VGLGFYYEKKILFKENKPVVTSKMERPKDAMIGDAE
jgi:hypothetical protein